MKDSFNEIGENSENIVALLLNRKLGTETFRVKFLGAKWPVVDFYVELINKTGYYFFVQVKSSTRGYSLNNVGKKEHLFVTLKKQKVIQGIYFQGPTYLIGLDYNKSDYFKSKAYIVSLSGSVNKAKSISKISIKNPLNPKTLLTLENEVLQFWSNLNSGDYKGKFQSKFK